MLVKKLIKVAAVALGFALAQAPGYAAVIYATGTNSSTIPGLSGFTTTGADMDGLSVTATFSSGFSETLLWADTGPASGGVSGTDWSLSLSGDSFMASWNFTNNRSEQLTVLVLDGLNALTVFDRSLPTPGTPGSFSGIDFNCTVCAPNDVFVGYDYQVRIGSNPPVGDLWQTVTVDFRASGPSAGWSFGQDTDNDIRITQAPEPSSLALLSLALGAVGLMSRRRKPAS